MWTLSYRVSIVMCDFVWVLFTELSSDYVAQAAHWYDYQKMWPETARILRKGGTAVFWVCPDLNLSACSLITYLNFSDIFLIPNDIPPIFQPPHHSVRPGQEPCFIPGTPLATTWLKYT